MKYLFLEWDSFGNPFIKKAWERAGYETILFPFPQKTEDTRSSEDLTKRIALAIMEHSVDFVFSFNYFATAAIACKACKVPYVSWTYDSPYIQLYSRTIAYETNYAFVFDKAECLRLQAKGADRVFYLPMAAPEDAMGQQELEGQQEPIGQQKPTGQKPEGQQEPEGQQMPTGQQKPTGQQEPTGEEKYNADIAMIGSMYTEKKHQLFRHLDDLDDYTKGYLDALMKAQGKIYGMSILESGLTKPVIENMQKVCPMVARGDGIEDIEWVFANYFLARKLTSVERKQLLQMLSKQFQVVLYTPEETPDLPQVENRGMVEYYTQAPLAMKKAKINLNISLRSIQSGMPLRAFDIMGNGGFLLTNYQEDFLEFFVPGEDYVYFESPEDLVEKCAYYLEHEKEREAIAASGYAKVQAAHTYKHRVQQMLAIVFGK